MTLPTITTGHFIDAEDLVRFYAEFLPDGHSFPVRVYGDTQEQAIQEAWSYLEDHDRVQRQKAKHDPVNSPAHYTRFPIEVIEITEHLNFCRGNAVKYLCRAGYKAAETEIEDLQKALYYVQREIRRLTRQQGATA